MKDSSKLEELDKTISELESQTQKLISFSEAYEKISEIKEDIQIAFEKADEQNSFIHELSDRFNSTIKNLKEFNLEMDNNIRTRLDINKSDLQLEIRNLGESQNKQNKKLLFSMKEELSKQNRKLNITQILIIILILCNGAVIANMFL
ncbi:MULTISPECIES: hypothetical protein [unclassified Oceanispirochaeta]|uniref:hypothetical protein n=1 Tax=unclassified Oceanispirochaeta TaxID=2635722 RepID=UPI000E09D40C|nr:MULTISPECIES: hypothetical protein [unclassified Oceanispirochaeta]MBF9018797.1 hypothetical protein [Oceanispirochaeta sp. M2]NPD75266.1 hypothetical protein [Oceanispirochaeta sp. M1]RDG28880.1 hypothetical protein DV872_24535 [Oceanispirochaeta sp. M1]